MGRKKLYEDGQLCSVEDCEREANARGWCRMHYSRAWKYGTPTEVRAKGRKPLIGPKKPRTPKEKVPRVLPTCAVGGCTELAIDRPNAIYCAPHHDISVRTKNRPRTVWKKTDDERFWDYVAKTESENECWIWVGRARKKKKGTYGQFNYQGRSIASHRYSYQQATGIELDSHTPVHHKCSNSLCVNPVHLQAITPQENTAEMLERRWYKARIAELEAKLAACTCG